MELDLMYRFFGVFSEGTDYQNTMLLCIVYRSCIEIAIQYREINRNSKIFNGKSLEKR